LLVLFPPCFPQAHCLLNNFSVGFYARIWWLDSFGGLVLSLVVMATWTITSMHHMRNLTGFSAQPDERNIRKLTANVLSALGK